MEGDGVARRVERGGNERVAMSLHDPSILTV
jgi:hypothetical protein